MPDPMPELDKDTAEYNPIMGTHRRRYGSLHQVAPPSPSTHSFSN
jgi:hypothetical protein